MGCPPTKRSFRSSALRTIALFALATSVIRASVGVRSPSRSATLDMGAASTTRSASRTSFSVEARWMAPHRAAIYSDYVPSRVTGGEADGAPDQADADDTQGALHAPPSAPITRSFSPESPTVTRLQPG